MTKTNFKKRVVTVAVASCLSFAPWLVEAASLGKITVLSGIGQPLRAEIEIAATRAELAGMSARLAGTQAFKEAGVDFAPALIDLRFEIGKRSNGTPIVKISSVKPVNDPFIDMLVELNWPSGPLLREYTFLLDPPEMTAKAVRQAPVANARVVDNSPLVTAAPAVAPTPRSETAGATAPARKPQESGTRVVERGDTLRRIAGETRHEGVSLEQMLIGLYKKNPDAFIGDNINRLKAGAILNIPDKATVAAVPAAEARQVYVTQVADWNAYRQKLAAAPGEVKPEMDASQQSAAGKIAPKVEDKPSAAEQAKDKVKVSSAEMAAKGAPAGKSAAVEEELIAKDLALKEAQDRLATLEKNVGDLQKLVDMKTQRLAELQQQVSGQTVVPVEPAKPAETPKAPESAAAEPPKAAEEPKPIEPPKAAEEPKPAEPPKAAEAPKPAAPVAPPKPVPASTTASKPGFLDQLGDSLPLIGGGGILALLAGYFLLRRRRSDSEPEFTSAVPAPSSLGPNSVFRMTGGQSVDTGNIPLQTGDFSQTGPGTIDTDEVDPVAEADVYMAYGRDAQAEEILIEALRKDPHRTAIHVKLLEIYANRKSVKQFDTLASELYSQTGGVGPEWEKVVAMGAALDSDNPLYSGGQAAVSPVTYEPVPTPDAATSGKATVVMPGELGQMAAVAAIGAALASELPASEPGEAPRLPELPAADAVNFDSNSQTIVSSDDNTLDFDLSGVGRDFAPAVTQVSDVIGELEAPQIEAIDFDLGGIPQEALTIVETNPEFLPMSTQVVGVSDDESRLTETFIGLEAPVGLEEEQPPVIDAGPMDFELGDIAVDSAADIETLVDPGALNGAVNTDSAEVGTETIVNSLEFAEPGHGELTVTDGRAGLAAEFEPNDAEYDVSLSESVFIGNPMPSPEFDIASINLDLSADTDEPTQVVGLSDTVIGNNAVSDPGFEEGSTKLALAKAYEEMGDLDQARELLQEVIDEGSGDLVKQAREIIGRLRG